MYFCGKKVDFMNDVIKKGPHPLLQNALRIKTNGVVVLKNITSLPTFSKPYASSDYVVCLCHRGRVSAHYDMQPVTFVERDIAIIYPNHIISTDKVSSDYCATLLVISDDFLKKTSLVAPFKNNMTFKVQPSFNLNENQYKELCSMLDSIHFISELDSLQRSTILYLQMEVFAFLIDAFRNQSRDADNLKFTHNQKIVARFYEEITIHYQESREVSFYAHLLCLSPKYFGAIVKQATGMSAGECIEKYVITVAKTLLRTRNELTIQQISERLGFEVQADFSRYFKRATNMSPKEYRMQQE